MAKEVASLVKEAQENGALRTALMSDPEQVARDRNVPALVTKAAVRALGVAAVGLAALGVWF